MRNKKLNRWRSRRLIRWRSRRLIRWRERSMPMVMPFVHLGTQVLTEEG